MRVGHPVEADSFRDSDVHLALIWKGAALRLCRRLQVMLDGTRRYGHASFHAIGVPKAIASGVAPAVTGVTRNGGRCH